MDHIGVPLSWKVPLKHSLHSLQTSIWVAIAHLLQYILYGTGFFLLPIAQISIFIRSSLLSPTYEFIPSPPKLPAKLSTDLDAHNPANIPDLEILPVPINLNPAQTFTTREGIFSLLCILVRPKSTGSVYLASADPQVRPIVDLGTLASPEDVTVLRKGVHFTQALACHIFASGWAPMTSHEIPASPSDMDVDTYIRSMAQTEYHYSSTCRMAPEEEGGVVDDELKVHGVKDLRVADASIFPTIMATHTQAPTVAVAEKCADMVRNEWRHRATLRMIQW